MKMDKATLHVLAGYTEHYLQAEDILFIEATNRSSQTITRAAFRELLDGYESESGGKLVVSQVIHGITKWKITGAGRAWLKES